MQLKPKLIEIYDKKYKELMFITVAILFLAIIFLGAKYFFTGELIDRGISLKGGVEVSFAPKNPIDLVDLQNKLSKSIKDVEVRSTTELGAQKEIIIEASDVSIEEILLGLKNAGIKLNQGEYTSQQIGSKLGETFFKQMIIAILFAFIAISLVIYITFRDFVPSSFVVLCAFADIVTTFAVVSLINVKLSIAGVAAFLMLLGYSVDTDILLTTRVLKNKEGKILDNILGAMRTGMTMSLTSFAAVFVSYLLTQSSTIKEITIILSFGLIADIYNTWILNAGILRWHIENKHGKN
ncbi:protein translocase subunit SecF [archaeon]|nr:protein translocase subunit SecF [archaeon]